MPQYPGETRERREPGIKQHTITRTVLMPSILHLIARRFTFFLIASSTNRSHSGVIGTTMQRIITTNNPIFALRMASLSLATHRSRPSLHLLGGRRGCTQPALSARGTVGEKKIRLLRLPDARVGHACRLALVGSRNHCTQFGESFVQSSDLSRSAVVRCVFADTPVSVRLQSKRRVGRGVGGGRSVSASPVHCRESEAALVARSARVNECRRPSRSEPLAALRLFSLFLRRCDTGLPVLLLRACDAVSASVRRRRGPAAGPEHSAFSEHLLNQPIGARPSILPAR